ncbi:hypothetical protein [Oleiharenicola lentus]|uniref:hypothetical protein n=1 Tax=Oleiharenicola lentus TaxID=2508720 RepID=UPI003F678798
MKSIVEVRRLKSPAPKPQALAWDGSTLWIGSRDTKLIHAIDPNTWTVKWTTPAPGTPWGMTAVAGELRVLCGETAADTRIIRRCVPGKGFDAEFGLPCPGDMGSHLSHDGKNLILSQWYPKKLIWLHVDGSAGRVIEVTRGICGHCLVDGVFYLMTTDYEETTGYFLTRVDPRGATPTIEDIATVPFQARALAFDGTNFWTNHREQDETVCFARPD